MIICRVCGKSFNMITNTHLKGHGLTTESYKIQFPDAILCDERMKEKYKETRFKVQRHVCAHPECNNLVTESHNKYCSSRCSMSHRMSLKWRNEQSGDNNHRFTNGWVSLWRHKKKQALLRDDGNCRWCGKKPGTKKNHFPRRI
jgi:hypothetical protein